MAENYNQNQEHVNWKALETAEISPEAESRVDFAQMERSFADGTAGECLGYMGALAPETLLEEQGDDRTLPEIPSAERAVIEEQFTENVGKYNLRLAKDETSLLAYAA